ncbi:adenosylcobinamide-phosphate synthase CbiB [Desulfonatronospira sp.]|uniref:adenosylcobinamide-phosphate synthase CbiB n=1 Tax=Desulfonatronospira sp. TaxID=1962951 RepID=UPI0025C14DDD|nr:adenosylcobinamide-phosphate synthase CbiB [Desulfonatronospira sp.]
MIEAVIILVLAFALDLFLGDPVYRLHPVRCMGAAISRMEEMLFFYGLSGRGGGIILVAVMLTGVSALVLAGLLLASMLPGLEFLIMVFLVYSCMGLKDLVGHTRPVALALEKGDLVKARQKLQMIVGRDPSVLDASGVARSAVESVAENFVDGFLALAFWFVAGCILGQLVGVDPAFAGVLLAVNYRMVNTLDAMVGYRSSRYMQFGRFAARLDDVLNHVPARLSMLVISLAALVCGYDWRNSLVTGLRDRRKHASPNAGHSEAAMAGALDIRLGGPVQYAFALVEKPWMGEEGQDAGWEHIRSALRIIQAAAWISLALAAGVLAAGGL